nr:MAG TPA: hypothetical protein [Caudoviricetes sp.]
MLQNTLNFNLPGEKSLVFFIAKINQKSLKKHLTISPKKVYCKDGKNIELFCY